MYENPKNFSHSASTDPTALGIHSAQNDDNSKDDDEKTKVNTSVRSKTDNCSEGDQENTRCIIGGIMGHGVTVREGMQENLKVIPVSVSVI